MTDRQELMAALLAMLAPSFVTDDGDIPADLLPELAELAVPMATSLLEEALSTADAGPVFAAAGLWQRIVDAIPAASPDRAGWMTNLGIALEARFDRTGALADLDAAADAALAAVSATPAGHPGRPGRLSNLSGVLLTRFEQTGHLADVNAAIEAARAAVAAASGTDPRRAEYQSNLGTALEARFARTGALPDVDAAIESLRAAAAAMPGQHPNHAGALANLGIALHARFTRTDALPDLDAAIESLQQAAQATSGQHPNLGSALTDLGIALHARFARTGALPDVDAAIESLRTAVDVTRSGQRVLAGRLSNLGSALLARFQSTGDPADLDAALEAAQAAVDATADDDPALARRLSNLGNAFWASFEAAGRLTDADVAVRYLQAAADADHAEPSERAGVLSNLGNALRSRFERTGMPADLDASIRAGQAAVDATAGGDPALAGRLSNLGSALRARFERTGTMADLDSGIAALQTAASVTPDGHPALAGRLSNLGIALQARFERAGALADLDAAVSANRAAADATPRGHPSRAIHLSNLGNALRARGERTGEPADLDAAVDVLRAAAGATAAGHPERSMYLSNLGIALQARFERAATLADLDAAIEALRTAVDASPAGHPDLAMYLSNLGAALQTRYRHSTTQADLDNAILAGQAAADALTADHPDRAAYLWNLGVAAQTRFRRTRTAADRDLASSSFIAAAKLTAAPASVRIRAARSAASLIAGTDRRLAGDLLAAAVEMLSEVAPRQLARTDQHHAVGGFAGLAAEAAALALEGTPDLAPSERQAARALGLLEAGRAVLLSQALDARDDLTDLRGQYPQLAQRFTRLRDELDQPADTPRPVTEPVAGAAVTAGLMRAQERYQLASQFAQTLADIRRLPEFASFGRPPAPHQLLTEAAGGPVVTFNISSYRSDALALTDSGIACVCLPALTPSALTGRISTFYQALHVARSSGHFGERIAAQRELLDVLGWLWDVAVGPVLDVLGYYGPPGGGSAWPRVWWATGGLLSLLPLHAAGHHDDPASSGQPRRTVMDRVVSSYTPTIRALRYARQHACHPDRLRRALIVAMPTTPGQPDLGYVPAEVAALRAILPAATVLTEPAQGAQDHADVPSRARVLSLLPGCSIAHFACHGESDQNDPSKSRLLLHDHVSAPLTVASLATVSHDQLELVYLSACHTARTRPAELLDEAIHLTSAFQLAGSRHVIGTLWDVSDVVAADIAAAFYAGLRTSTGIIDTDRAALALHEAVRDVRGRFPHAPSLWASHTHAGA